MGTVKRHDPPFNLLDQVARELAASLDATTMPQEQRPEARRLLMTAWLALQGPRNAATGKAAASLARHLDELVASASQDDTISGAVCIQPDRLGIADRLLTSRPSPIQERLSALENSVDDLARRTRRMVEHAQAAAGIPDATDTAAVGTKRLDVGRSNLELVWGDSDS